MGLSQNKQCVIMLALSFRVLFKMKKLVIEKECTSGEMFFSSHFVLYVSNDLNFRTKTKPKNVLFISQHLANHA